jgi:hypothetical protein
MKTNVLFIVSAALTSAASIGNAATPPKPKPDPIVTETSLETVAVELDGLTLNLPAVLNERAIPKKLSEKQTDLSIGNIDFAYKIGTGEHSMLVTGWAEFEGGKFPCDASKMLGTIQSNVKTDDRTEHQVQRIVNGGFNGYLMTTTFYHLGAMDGADVTLIDKTGGTCYNVNLALEFPGFKSWQIKKAISPIMDAATKSFVDFAK